MPRACVLEDHPAMREHLRALIESLPGGWHVTYAGADIAEACKIGGEDAFDCAVVDLDLGTQSGATDIAALARCGWPMLVVSAAGDPESVQRAIALGAAGFLHKDGRLQELESALAAAQSGEVFCSADLAGKLAVPRLPGISLLPDEQRALMLRASGMGYSGMATSLGCTPEEALSLVTSGINRYRAA